MADDPVDLVDDFPLKPESVETVRARLIADTNLGIDPTDPLWADMVPGSLANDLHGSVSIEFDRVYDRVGTELPRAALPTTASGAWLDDWASTLDLERTDEVAAFGSVVFTGTNGTAIGTGVQVSTIAPAPDVEPITFRTTASGTIAGGTLTLPVQAVDAGLAGNVAANTITLPPSELAGVTVTNPAPITGGADVETDEHLQTRIAKKLTSPAGAGNIAFYENYALNFSGVGFVTVQPNTPSPGHVTLIVTDANNAPFAGGSPVVSGLQQALDPTTSPGQGRGDAPAGATIVVSTPVGQNVTVTATIVPESGFTLDGTGGTRALRAEITASVQAYIARLVPGESPVLSKIIAAIVDVVGVADATGVSVAPTTITASQVAVFAGATLS